MADARPTLDRLTELETLAPDADCPADARLSVPVGDLRDLIALIEVARSAGEAPSHYRQGMEDGEDHCDVCDGALSGESGHTHAECFEEGKSLGALDENLDCASKLAERIGCEMGYFGEVLERVPPARRLPGELWPARAECVELVFADPTNRDLETVIGLRLTALVAMPADTARFTREHMMLVKLRRATVQVSIDDNGHTCASDDGVTCGLCQRDMSPGSAHTEATRG